MTLFDYVKRHKDDIATREQTARLERWRSFNMKAAIDAHLVWLNDFRQRIQSETGSGPLNETLITSERLCELGRWLQDLARSGQGSSAEFEELNAVHAEFHRTAGDICLHYNHGRQEISRRRLNGDLRDKSDQVQLAIVRYFSTRR